MYCDASHEIRLICSIEQQNILILVFWTFWYMHFVKELGFLIQLKFMWLIYQYPPAHGQLFIWRIACINKPESNNRKGLWFGFYGFWVCSGSGIEGFSIASFLPNLYFQYFCVFDIFHFLNIFQFFMILIMFDNFCVCEFCVFPCFFLILIIFLFLHYGNNFHIFTLW